MAPNAPVLYNYTPAVNPATLFAIFFFAFTIIHIAELSKWRSYYLAPLVVGGCFEWSGYIGRAIAHENLDNLGLFIFHTIVILLGPALFAATIYMILCRIILLTKGEAMVPIPANWMTATFVCGDVLAFMVQTTGGGLMSRPDYFFDGEHLIILGLCLQITFFCFFIVTAGIFHHRMQQNPTQASHEVHWQKHMVVLYIASVLILIRSIFRAIEFSGGYDGVIMRTETFLYVFDAGLMFAVMVIFFAVHPGEIHRCSMSVEKELGTERLDEVL